MAISDPLAAVLRSARDELNAQFAHAKRQFPALEPAAFMQFLQHSLDPVAVAVAARHPERVADVVRAGYAIGLELVAQRATVRSPGLARCFAQLLPALADSVAVAPERIIGALANAAHNLDSAGARTGWWLEAMAAYGPPCPDADALLRLGQLCAWCAGLAHYREGALVAADALPEALALAVFRAGDAYDWPALRAKLAADPWFTPDGPTEPRCTAVIGAFRGYGGLFLAPPRVSALGECFVVHSAGSAWLLIADAYGATFHHATAEEARSAPPRPVQAEWKPQLNALERAGIALPVAGEVTALASNGTTLAVTSALSHAVVLIAHGASA